MPELANARWEKYALNRASGMSKVAAYKDAGYAPSTAGPIALEKKQVVADRILEIQREMQLHRREVDVKRAIEIDIKSSQTPAQQLGITEGFLLTNLLHNMTSAQTAGNYAAANKALEMMMKVLGFKENTNQNSPERKPGGENPTGNSNINVLLDLAEKLKLPQALAEKKAAEAEETEDDDDDADATA